MKARRPPPPMPALAKQPSTRPNVSSVAFIAALTEAGSVTSQMRVSTLPGPADMVAAALLFFSALRPQIETLQPWRVQRLRDAEADAAIAAGDDGRAAGEVKDAH